MRLGRSGQKVSAHAAIDLHTAGRSEEEDILKLGKAISNNIVSANGGTGKTPKPATEGSFFIACLQILST